MKRSDFFKITMGLLAVAMLASLECGCNQHQNKTPSEIKIAVPVPLTGKYREFGLDLVNAAQMAVDEANAQGGLGGNPRNHSM